MKTKAELERVKETENITIDPQSVDKVTEMKRQKRLWHRKEHHFKIGWFARGKLRKKPDKTYLISMRFANGTKKNFIISTNKSTFTMKGKTYYLYYEECHFNISQNQYELEFHERFSVPLNREVMYDPDSREAFNVVTPEVLKSLIKFEYLKVLTESQSISKALKFIMLLAIIAAGFGLINLLLIWGMNSG